MSCRPRFSTLPVLLLLCALLGLTGCTSSLYPLLTERDLVKEYDLSGEWVSRKTFDDDRTRVVAVRLEALDRSTYDLKFTQGLAELFGLDLQKDKIKTAGWPKTWELKLGKLKGKYYIQLYPYDRPKQVPFVQGVPVYTIARVDVSDDTIKVFLLADDKTNKIVKQKSLAHVVCEDFAPGQIIALALPTDKLQEMVTENPGLFPEKPSVVFKRAAKKDAHVDGSTNNPDPTP